MSCKSLVVVVDAIPGTVVVPFWMISSRCWEERTIMKRRFEHENPSAPIRLFVETVPSLPNDLVSHRFRQVLANPRVVQEVTEHHKILWPLVLPFLALLHVRLLFAGNLSFG